MRPRPRNLAAVVILILIFAAGTAFAADPWLTYHMDHMRGGVNNTIAQDPSGLNLVWTFPRVDAVPLAGSSLAVDVSDSDPSMYAFDDVMYWSVPSSLPNGNFPGDFYGNNNEYSGNPGFRWTPVVTQVDVAKNPSLLHWARWYFPSTLPAGLYNVQVWFPSSGANNANAVDAQYTIGLYNGGTTATTTTVAVDQTNGGQWINVGTTPFFFSPGTTDLDYVELSNIASVPTSGKVKPIVCADAVRFVPNTSLEIYTSPVASFVSGIDSGMGSVPATWVGTIEGGIASGTSGVKDFGAFYCIRSYTGATWDINSANAWDPSTSEAMLVGTAAWRYPAGGAYERFFDGTTYRPRTPDERMPIEGPLGRIGVEGGQFSSATVVTIPGTGETAIVFGGMDGQVYCVNASTGKLIWRGPGVTIPETQMGKVPSGWDLPIKGRADAFGGDFISAPVVATDPGAGGWVTYDIKSTTSDPGTDAAKTDTGHLYAIYAWMPGMEAGDPERSSDAAYGVTYFDTATGASKTDWYRVDQSTIKQPDEAGIEDKNVGKWVRIGGKFWNPSEVAVSPMSIAHDKASGRVVVTDAIMVVPEEIGAFKYSTAVSDGTKVYIGNMNGRVYGLDLAPLSATNYTTHLSWTCPNVQTKNPANVVNPKEAGVSPFGSIVASPAIFISSSGTSVIPETLVVPSIDGKVYGINKTDGTVDWTYNARTDSTNPGEPDTVGEAFTSSPTIDPSRLMVYIPSTSGRIHALKYDKLPANGVMTAEWIGIDDSQTDKLPFSPFRFSTAAVMPTGEILCGSTGGVLQRLTSAGKIDTNFFQPDFFAPIQGAVAVDGNNIYIGTMASGDSDDGGIWWVNNNNGLAVTPADVPVTYSGYSGLGSVFSSPAVANDYVYVGISKGRLLALSSTAFSSGGSGSTWVGGGLAGVNSPPFSKSESLTPATSVQVDVYSGTTWEATKAFLESNAATLNIQPFATTFASAGPNVFTDTGANSIETDPVYGHHKAYGTPGSKNSNREMYFEWGDSVYLMTWNLPPLKNIAGGNFAAQKQSISFKFVNSSAGAGAGGGIDPRPAEFLYEYQILDKTTNKVENRCVAGTRLDIKSDKPNPPAPGPGWKITVNVNTVSTTGTTTTNASKTAFVPLLKGSPGAYGISGKTFKGSPVWTPQPVGFNNPLAIQDDGYKPTQADPKSPDQFIRIGLMPRTRDGLAWPDGNGPYIGKRNVDQAHFNGNSLITNNSLGETIPHIALGNGPHGANTRTGRLNVMDRSAIGLTDGGMIKSFRIQAGDLQFTGDNGSIINPLPWDVMPYVTMGTFNSRVQVDYPDISKQETQFQKTSDSADPSNEKTTLQPATAVPDANGQKLYENATIVPDPVEVSVEVPKFQPASFYHGTYMNPGYRATAIAYIDSNGNGRFEGGNNISGRPTTYVETYRKFKVSLDVPVDYHMVVDQPMTIDITGPDRAAAPHGLGIGVANTLLTDWYKEFTVQNLGNVNLAEIKIARSISDGTSSWPFSLYADNVDPNFPLSTGPGVGVVSSFDGWDPTIGTDVAAEPYVTTSGNNYLGYTLSKARVGDVDPTTMMLPDSRKVKWLQMVSPWNGKQIKPSVSVCVPLTQPSGSYHAYVPVFCDLINTSKNDVLNYGAEPFTDPSFRINVTVAEDRLTGGTTQGSAPQIDSNLPLSYGDTQPTAWRDPVTGNVHLFWSSNRPDQDPNNPPSTIKPDTAWYLRHADLTYYDKATTPDYEWLMGSVAGLPMWWNQRSDRLLATDPAWPTPATNILPTSIKHTSPFAAVVPGTGNVWLFWQGLADFRDPITNKISREYRIFYTPATNGDVSGSGPAVYNFGKDLSLLKMNPKAMVYNTGSDTNMWLLWNGGDAGRWSLYGNLNISPKTAHDTTKWSPDTLFQTPSCLVSVAEPMPMQRKIDYSPLYTADGRISNTNAYMDVAFTGVSKYDQASDIIMARYCWNGTFDKPVIDFAPFPRVTDEELRRDTKLNVYTSEHLAWVRDTTDPSPDAWTIANKPAVRVKFPDNTALTATNGTVQIDRATGVYTYSYTAGSPEATLLGQTLIDFSGGIVRFTKPVPQMTKVYADYTPQAKRLTRGPEQDSAPYVFIEKTPLQFSDANRNIITPGLQPQSATTATVDRMWLFWRKPSSSGILSSTIYYKTFRVSVNLPKAVKLGTNGCPISTVTVTGPGGATIPVEVNWDGTKLYFQASAEIYPALNGGTVAVSYIDVDGSTQRLKFDTVTWQEELPATAIPTRQSVNEGQICAFADSIVPRTKIWLFWSSTRAGESDLFYQTISPNFRPR